MQNSTIEMVTFKPKAGITAQQLIDTGPAMEAFLREQPGFIYRSLSTDDDGLWHDIIYWQTQENATAAGEQFMNHSAGQALMALIEMSSTKMRHMQAKCEVLVDSPS